MVSFLKGFCKAGPKFTLAYLTMVNNLIYLDRGAIAGVLSKVKDNLDLSSIEAGLLGSVFMLGFMASSPFMAHSAQYVHPHWLMVLGLSTWTAAVILCGFTDNFILLCVFRAFTGVGEASFVALAPPHIMRIAPTNSVAIWLAIFYSAIFIGTAFGYIYSSILATHMPEVAPGLESWHWPFIIEGLIMFPFIVLITFLYKDPSMYVRKETTEDDEEEETKKASLSEQICALFSNPVFVALAFGYSGYAFTLGGLSYWAPDVIHELYDISTDDSAFLLGSITIVCGLTASLFGSFILDFILRSYTKLFNDGEMTETNYNYYRAENATRLLAIFTSLGAVFGITGVALGYFPTFIAGIAISEFFLFSGTGPAGVSLMTSVPPELRGMSNACAIFIMHSLGDFPSPLVIGVFIYFWGYHIGMLICLIWLCNASFLWTCAWNFAVRFK